MISGAQIFSDAAARNGLRLRSQLNSMVGQLARPLIRVLFGHHNYTPWPEARGKHSRGAVKLDTTCQTALRSLTT